MLRRAHENGSQPTNQSISPYKDTAETKLNCISLPSISEKINYFYFYFFWWSGVARRRGNVELGGGQNVLLVPTHCISNNKKRQECKNK